MDKRVKKTILAIVMTIIGFVVLAVFTWNVFALDLPDWVYFASGIVGYPLAIWSVSLLILTNRKQK